MRNPPSMGASDVWKNDPPSPGTGFTQIQQLVTLFGGSRKVTFMVVSGGTTLGVTVPHCRLIPVSVSSVTNNVVGSELSLRTVTVHFRPPGTTNGVGVGLGVAVGVGLGVALGVALGTATAAWLGLALGLAVALGPPIPGWPRWITNNAPLSATAATTTAAANVVLIMDRVLHGPNMVR
jgi:hypothetical protein